MKERKNIFQTLKQNECTKMPLQKCFDYILRTHVNDDNGKAGRQVENTKCIFFSGGKSQRFSVK